MEIHTEEQVLQKISVLEDRFREYQESTRARMIAMGFLPGEDRPTHLAALYENEIQTTAFNHLICAEKQKLQKIRDAEEKRRRLEAQRAALAAATAVAEEAEAARAARAKREKEEAMIREQALHRAIASILATIT